MVGVCYISGQRDDTRAQLFGGLLEAGPVTGIGHHRPIAFHQRTGDGQTKSAGAASDKRHGASRFLHRWDCRPGLAKKQENSVFNGDKDKGAYHDGVPIAEHPALSALPATKRALLNTLKKAGELGVEELSVQAGLTVSAVRQQLTGLQRDGLVEVVEARQARGRPRHRFRLTAAADALYPRAYAELTNELLDYVGEADPALMEEIFRRRRQRRIDGARTRLRGCSGLAEKMEEIARILDDDGYPAEAVAHPDGSYTIVEHNCAILGIAMRYGQACGSELEFIRAVLPEAKVERVSHIMAGAHHCSYSVKLRAPRK